MGTLVAIILTVMVGTVVYYGFKPIQLQGSCSACGYNHSLDVAYFDAVAMVRRSGDQKRMRSVRCKVCEGHITLGVTASIET